VDLDKAYMHLILTLDPNESEAGQGQEGYICFWKLCLKHPSFPNAVKFYYDAMRVVRRGKEKPSEFERGSAPNDFIQIDPRLFDPSFSDTYSSANDGTTTQPSATTQDLQPLAQRTMAQNSNNAQSAKMQNATMKEESSFVYTAEERKAITDKARSSVNLIFADDQAASAMVNNAFFPDSLYEDTANGAKQPQKIPSQGVTNSQNNVTYQGFPMPCGINRPNEIVNNHGATSFQPYNAPHINNATFHCLGDSQPVSASPVHAEGQRYNAVLHGMNSFLPSNKHGLFTENQPFAVAQAHTVPQRVHTSQGFVCFQHSLPSYSFAEPNEPNFHLQVVGHHGASSSRSFIPSYASGGNIQVMPDSESFNGFQTLDTDFQHFRGIQPFGEHPAYTANQPYAVNHAPTVSGGMVSTHAGAVSQGIAGFQGIPTSHVFTGSQALSGANQHLAGSDQFATSQLFYGNQLSEGYQTFHVAPQYNENQPFGVTQPYATSYNSTAIPGATTAHDATVFGHENVKPTITWAEKRQRDMDVAMERFEVKRRKVTERFYDGDYRQTSYHDQGPTIGVVLTPTTGETDSEGSEAHGTEAGDSEAGNIETGGMETDGNRDW
jgi:hypothetical protein